MLSTKRIGDKICGWRLLSEIKTLCCNLVLADNLFLHMLGHLGIFEERHCVLCAPCMTWDSFSTEACAQERGLHVHIGLLGKCIAHQLQTIGLQSALHEAMSSHTDRKQSRTLRKPWSIRAALHQSAYNDT